MSWIEKSMMQVVWNSFEEKGWNVWAEQEANGSRVDLVFKHPGGGFAMVECKGGPALQKFTLGIDTLDQLARYIDEHSLHEIIFCVPEQDVEMVLDYKKRILEGPDNPSSKRNRATMEKLRLLPSPVFPPNHAVIPERDLRLASNVKLNLTTNREEHLRHRLWKGIVGKELLASKILENLGLSTSTSIHAVCEGIIRKSYEKIEDKIDLALLIGSNDPFSNKLKAIVGIEAKVDLSDTGILSQLDRYAESENLNQIYLAVPSSLALKAVKLLLSSGSKHSNKVGVISVAMPSSESQSLDSFNEESRNKNTGTGIEIVRSASTITENPDVAIATSLSDKKKVRSIYGTDENFEKYVLPYS